MRPPKGDTPSAIKDINIRTAKPLEKPYKLTDEKGLFLLINPNGSKYWRFKYRFGGKEKLLSIGLYPEITLSVARDVRDKARKQLIDNIDPGLIKQISKRSAKLTAENSFETVAREWFVKHASQ